MQPTRLTAVACALAFAAAACESTPTGTLEPSHFAAQITGDVEASYSGTGYFTTSEQRMPGHADVPPFLMLHSSNGRSGTGQTFQLFRRSAEIPAIGNYSIGAEDEGIPFQVTYSLESSGMGKRFTARSGTLTINESSGQRIAGSFRFLAVLTATCTYTPGSVTCSPVPVDESPAVIEVEGTFEAVSGRPGRWHL